MVLVRVLPAPVRAGAAAVPAALQLAMAQADPWGANRDRGPFWDGGRMGILGGVGGQGWKSPRRRAEPGREPSQRKWGGEMCPLMGWFGSRAAIVSQGCQGGCSPLHLLRRTGSWSFSYECDGFSECSVLSTTHSWKVSALNWPPSAETSTGWTSLRRPWTKNCSFGRQAHECNRRI